MTPVWDGVVGQDDAVAVLAAAAGAAASMTHAWLFTGPPGSGRSVAARAFAAALQCTAPEPGCGSCPGCHTVLAGTHADGREGGRGLRGARRARPPAGHRPGRPAAARGRAADPAGAALGG